jgi:glutamate racemase
MADGPIAFIDSGVGGLPYLASTRRFVPGKRMVYAADRENFPYGEKSAEEITRSVLSLTDRLIRKEDPRLIVVACNTMSVVALAALRSRFSLPFVGVVPAVKPAAAASRAKCVGVLATQRTVEGRYLKDLIEKHAAGCRVASLPAADLVSFVEEDYFRSTPEERRARVRREAELFRREGVDTVVLACTHFLHLEEEFKAELGKGIAVVDSREGVARQVARLLDGAEAAHDERQGDCLYLTGPNPIEERYVFFARKFGLSLAGII